MHLKSKYEGPTTLDFAGDDDIWVFVNGRLVIDLGGIHTELVDTVNLGALHVPFVGCGGTPPVRAKRPSGSRSRFQTNPPLSTTARHEAT